MFGFCHFYFHISPSPCPANDPDVAGQSRCEGSQVFVKEADVVMRGAREMARLTAASLSQCTDKCRYGSVAIKLTILNFSGIFFLVFVSRF